MKFNQLYSTTEHEQVGFVSLHTLEGITYIDNHITENPIKEAESFYEEAKKTHETIEIPTCKINRY